MQTRTGDTEVQEVLDQIAVAVTAGDGLGVMALWELPALVVGETMAQVIDDVDEGAKFFGGAKQQYREMGITDTRAVIEELEWLGKDVAIAKVHWPYLDEANHEVGGERSDYTFKRDDSGALKVRSVLMRGVDKPQ